MVLCVSQILQEKIGAGHLLSLPETVCPFAACVFQFFSQKMNQGIRQRQFLPQCFRIIPVGNILQATLHQAAHVIRQVAHRLLWIHRVDCRVNRMVLQGPSQRHVQRFGQNHFVDSFPQIMELVHPILSPQI